VIFASRHDSAAVLNRKNITCYLDTKPEREGIPEQSGWGVAASVPSTSDGGHRTRAVPLVQSGGLPHRSVASPLFGVVPDRNFRILDLESGKLTKLLDSEGLIEPRWSADGRYIAALNPKQKQVLIYDCKLEKWSVLSEANFPAALRRSPGGDALYYQDVDEVEESTFRVPMATRETERVIRLGDLLSSGAARCMFTGLSPDGSVYVTVDHGDVYVYAVDLKLP